mgnify:CR=1 FL=1
MPIKKINKITTFESGQTVVTANFMNSLYSSENGETASGDTAYGHVHDGLRLDGHAQKVNLGDHVDGFLDPEKIDGNIVSKIYLEQDGSGQLSGDSLIEPDGPVGSINFIASDGITIEADSDTRTITFKTTDQVVEYHLSGVTEGGFSAVRLSSTLGNEDVFIKNGANVSVSTNLSGEIIIASDNTTYSISAESANDGALLRLTGSDAFTYDVKFQSGNNISISRIDQNTINISAPIDFDNISPLTTKGDLLTRNTLNNIRVPVGTLNQILAAKPASPAGISWVNLLTLFPSGNDLTFLRRNSATPSGLDWVVAGDVVGPASATDTAIARFDTISGKLIQDSSATLNNSGLLTTASISTSNLTYIEKIHAPEASRYLNQNSLNAAINSGIGRYFIGMTTTNQNQNLIFNIQMPIANSHTNRVFTIANAGNGKIIITKNGQGSDAFDIPFSSVLVDTMELKAGTWVELISIQNNASGIWRVVCGGTFPDYSSP